MKHTRESENQMTRAFRILAVILVSMLALIFLGTTAPEVLAQLPLELEAEIFFETNFTDKDTGIQVFADGEPWEKIKIFDPDGKLIFKVKGKGELKDFGLTELFSESNEPNWVEEESLADIVDRFPEGEYVFEGKTTEGDEMEGEAELSHELPCAPTVLSPALNVVVPVGPIVISWVEVENSLDNENEVCSGNELTEDAEIEFYQIVVENLSSERDFSIFVDPDQFSVTLPPEFVTANSAYKYEVIAKSGNGNQTIAEIALFCTDSPCVAPEE